MKNYNRGWFASGLLSSSCYWQWHLRDLLLTDGQHHKPKGGTYSGNWESLDSRTPAVSVQTSEPVIIENSNIRMKKQF